MRHQLRLALIPLLFTLAVVMGACQPPAAPDTVDVYAPGEPVRFQIDETIYLCSGELPYAVLHLGTDGRQPVRLEHSCDGEAGVGMDQFCVNGQVESVEVGSCSDAIWCEEVALDEQVTWDQQAYVELAEQCGGETIRREILQQVPAGEYQVVVQLWKADRGEEKTVYPFAIRP